MPNNELIQHGGAEVQRAAPVQIADVIAAAIRDPSVDPARLDAFLAFKLKLDAIEAEKEFNREFAAAMLEMPRVVKRGKKDMTKRGEPRGSGGIIAYETYEDLDSAIRPIEAAHGFARSFLTKPAPDGKRGCIMVLRLTHRAGHSITSERYCPPDPGPGRAGVQEDGSGESYGRRYSTKAIWNVVTIGADDDGDSADPISDEQALGIRDMLNHLALEPPKVAKLWAWIGPPATSPETVQRGQYEKLVGYLRGLMRGAK